MKVFVFLFTGYRQGNARPSGFESLYQSLDAFRAPGVTIEVKPWWTDVAALARFVNRQIVGKNGAEQYRIVVAGYSYGGDRAVRFCRELHGIGIQVRELLLVDPVWRPYYPLIGTKNLPSLLSILPFPVLRVPPNVRAGRAWAQKNGVFAEWPVNPRGHRVIPDDRTATQWHGTEQYASLHSEMDDHRAVKEAVVSAVRNATRTQ